MKTLNVIGMDFIYKAALRGYQSAILTRAWNGIGTLEVEISSGITNANLIQQDDILWFDTDYHKAFIVEKIETTQAGSAKVYRISASHINVLLRDFITMPPDGTDYDARSGTREQIVRAWVDANCINPTDPTRAQYPIVLGALQGLGDSITDQTRLKGLSDEIVRVLMAEDLGWGLVLDIPNQQYVFNVYAGTDRTAGQSTNNRILFGMRYGNIAGYRKVIDSSNAKTVAYIGGQGQGAERSIVEVDASGSGRRKETFIDSRDTDDPTELAERGLQALTDAAAVDSYEFEALNRQFTYETDYDLGDFVTIVTDTNAHQDMQIQKIQEIYEPGNISVIPEFGKPERTIGRTVNGISKRLEALETAEPLANRVLLINNTGEASVKGKLVHPDSANDLAVTLVQIDIPDSIGVIYESGVPEGEKMWVVFAGVADVYFSGSATRGHLARSPIAADAGAIAGQAISEALPAPPFSTDKHFCEIGHVLESRTGAGLAKCILHFN